MSLHAVSRAQVEEFLARDAWLLDTWQLDEWLTLFVPHSRYLVPSTDQPQGDPTASLYLVDDDYRQLRYRVKRLFHPQGHAEQPHSVTQRLVTNVLLRGVVDGALAVHAAFLIARTRRETADTFVGRYAHRLVLEAGGLRFLERKAILAMPGLRPVGTLSIIV